MNGKYLHLKPLVPVVLVGLLLLTQGCSKLTQSSKITQEIDSCANVPQISWGNKGAMLENNADLIACYDWVLMSKEHYRKLK